ncbi:MAG TPA: hypothetical protein VEU33_31670, partial [Archangium sp.]|nr:hypothetical protein [Archangium sp.]
MRSTVEKRSREARRAGVSWLRLISSHTTSISSASSSASKAEERMASPRISRPMRANWLAM